MKRAVLAVAVLAAMGAAVVALAEATQNRPDPVLDGSVTTVEFRVSTRRYFNGEDAAASALWAACSGTVRGDLSLLPEAVPGADGVWRVSIAPAIGEHGENRLVGCLEDMTVDRILGDVVALRTRP